VVHDQAHPAVNVSPQAVTRDRPPPAWQATGECATHSAISALALTPVPQPRSQPSDTKRHTPPSLPKQPHHSAPST